MPSLLCLALLSLIVFQLAGATNPGVKARITNKAISYANQIAQAALTKELQSLRIGDQSGSEHHFSWSLTNIRNEGVTPPASKISLDPAHNGLAWSVNNLGLNLKADWRVKYRKGWVKISTSGSIDASIKGASMSVSVRLGEDKDGRPSLSAAACSAHISDVDIHFHGGTAFILNLFRHTLEGKIKDLLQGQICQLVNKEVNVDAEAQMKKLKITVDIAKKFLLDYRLVSSPTVNSGYLETSHKGEVFWAKDMKESPMTPQPIPASADVSKMLYIWLTEYTANTFAYAAQSNNYLIHNFTADDLPAGNRSLLNTTCQTTMCIGKLIPQIGKACPDAVVAMTVTSKIQPLMNITNKQVTLTAKGNIDMYATKADKNQTYLLTLNMTVSLTLAAKVENERLTGQIIDNSFKFGVVKSNVGNVSARGLNIILGIAMESSVIPQLNALGKTGIALPVSGDVTFVNTSLEFLSGSLVVATDLTYKGKWTDGHTLKFESEHH